jgi:hypothetical protein
MYQWSLNLSVGIAVTFGLRAYAMWNRNRAILVIYCCVAIVRPLLNPLGYCVDFCGSGLRGGLSIHSSVIFAVCYM